MFYKFMGGSDEALQNTFDAAVGAGSLKFGSAVFFNDPFEFKFSSVAPTRAQFDAWHETNDRHRTPEELANAWKAFSGPAAYYNTTLQPRINILEGMYVLCLAQQWDSHLMWGHYCNSHHGFVIRYRPEIIEVLRSMTGSVAHGNVIYRDQVPQLKWFNSPVAEMGEILFSKPNEWNYEGEYRVVFKDEAGKANMFRTVDTSLIDGVVFGTRTSRELINRALALQRERSELKVEQVCSVDDSYRMVTKPLSSNVYSMTGIL